MKLQPDQFTVQAISGHGPGWLAVNGQKFNHSLVISSRGACIDWNCRQFAELELSHFAELAALGPELVLFGSGPQQRFARPEWLQPLIAKGIGIESMDTAAACRTYNFLAGEGRHVVAALLLESA